MLKNPKKNGRNSLRPPKPLGLRHMTAAWSKKEAKWAYYFNVRTTDTKAGCPLKGTTLGHDREAAQRAVDTVLWPQMLAWRSSRPVAGTRGPAEGTYDWMVKKYADSRFFLGEPGSVGAAPVKIIDGKETRVLLPKHRNRLWHLRLIQDFVLQDGRRVGELSLFEITPELREALLRALLFNPRFDKKTQQWVMKRRLTVRNQAFRYARSMWSVMAALRPDLFPPKSPFSEMRLKNETQEFLAASYDQLERFVRTCDEMGHPSIGNAAMITWEWLQRKEYILGAFDAGDYRPTNADELTYVEHAKTEDGTWLPLFDDNGAPLFEPLMKRLDAAKMGRVDGPMIFKDHVWKKTKKFVPWVSERGSSKQFDRTVRKIMVKAGLVRAECSPDERHLTFSSFRHGGLTELGEAGLTDDEIRHLLPPTKRRRSRQGLRCGPSRESPPRRLARRILGWSE